MKVVFNLVDFSGDIIKPDVFVCSEYEEVAEAVHQKSGMKNTPEMLTLPTKWKLKVLKSW